MIGLGTIVNVIAVITGGVFGLAFKKFLSKRLTDMIMQGLGLAVVIIGFSGALSAMFTVDGGAISANHTLVMIISLALGALVGELIGIEARLDSFARFCEKKFDISGESSTFAQGLMTATLVFCVGAMTIVGSLEDGINGNRDILFAKSALDAIAGMIFASTLGIGVLFSVIPLFIYQGALTLLAVAISPYLSGEVITQMSLIGSVLIIGIGFNMLGISKIKVGNLLPAIFAPNIYYIITSIVF